MNTVSDSLYNVYAEHANGKRRYIGQAMADRGGAGLFSLYADECGEFEEIVIESAASAAARALGAIKTDRKAAASRANGSKGGRPVVSRYRVDVDFIDHSESKHFGNKKDALAFARDCDWETTVFKYFGEQYGWQMIGRKDRYSRRVNTVAF